MFSMVYSLTTLAVAGGGGSGGSSGGGPESFIILVGFVPSYFLGKLIKLLLPRKAELIVSASFAVLATAALLIVAVNLDGLVGFGTYLAVLVATGVWIGWATIFFDIGEKIKARSKKAKLALATAARNDGAWNEVQLTAYARSVFERYQYDWSTFDLTSITGYTTTEYARHSALLLRTLKELKRTNRVSDIVIRDASIVDLHDDADDNKDTFQVAFQATLKDDLIDDSTGEFLYTRTANVVEYWTFARQGSDWKLARIDQQTAQPAALQQSMVDFAGRNNMYYSLDMGWLFLPRKGLLFKGGKFGSSDIDNHVVGTYNDHLVQMYTYTAASDEAVMFVAQITVPKDYDGIVVRRRLKGLEKLFKKLPQGYQEYRFEWADFNDRYQVLATSPDRLAAFELLNPGFMAYLYDTQSTVSIEVTDNIIYLYKDITRAQIASGEYDTMMTILMKAFKELQL